jgi:2-polyprenyl-6-methoxyphenol hydroxylase-like FAD-dependent oxidoreductase
LNIAIIGAGPAGLACAWQLTEKGHAVTVLECKSNLDTQGSGVLLQPIGLFILERLGIRQEAELLGHKIKRITGWSTPSNRITVNVDYHVLRGTDYSLGIDRKALWELLYMNAVEAGVTIEIGVSVSQLKYQPNGLVSVVANDGNKIFPHFELVIDSSGANSQLRKYTLTPVSSQLLQYGSLWCKVNLDKDSPYNTDTMILYTDKNNVGLGLMPSGRTSPTGPELITLFFNLNWKNCPNWNADNFQQWKQGIVKEWPDTQHLLDQIHHYDQLYLAKFRQHTLPKPYGDRIAYIGDSAHATNPQLGQGINMSLIDAISLPWALEKEADLERALKLYSKVRRNHVAIYQTLARALTQFYQTDDRVAITLRDAFYPVLSKLFLMKTATAYLVSGQVGRPLRHLNR